MSRNRHFVCVLFLALLAVPLVAPGWALAAKPGTPNIVILLADGKLYWRGNKPQLFNLKDDVGEARDRSAERADVVETLAAKLEAWEKQVSPPEELYAR